MRLQRLFRSWSSEPDPEQLRSRLFDALAADDGARFASLCDAHQDLIVRHFDGWRDRTPEVADDERRLDAYVRGLLAIANYMAERRRRPELLARLCPPDQKDPSVPWRETLAEAQRLMQDMRYAEAASALGDLLIDLHGFRGSGLKPFLALVNGMLAHCHFHDGKAAYAPEPAERALALCEEAGEADNVRGHLVLLYEAHRYLGQAERAATFADRLCAHGQERDRPDEAARWRRQAAVVRAGEPLNRVVVRDGDRYFELDEFESAGGRRLEFVFRRNRLTLRPAEALTERGERLGSEGDLPAALKAFRIAAAQDPFDPHSRYRAAVTLLRLGRCSEGVACLQHAERLAPGWFNTRWYLWLARRMALGELEARLFEPLSLMNEPKLDADRRLRLAEQFLSILPDLAPVHLAHGATLWELGRRPEAGRALRRGLACVEEPDMRTQLLFRLALVTPSEEERTALLREAIALNGNLVAAAMARLTLERGWR